MKSKPIFLTNFDQVDLWIRSGQFALAQAQLPLLAKAAERSDLPVIAHLAWRAGLPQLGAKILHPYVRPPSRRPETASEIERVHYAGCLIRIGVLEEAELLLAGADPDRMPLVLLFKSFIAMARWEYADVIKLLQRYLSSHPAPYEQLVAKVNLASALIFEEKHIQATALLREVTHIASLYRYKLLLANALELSAANFIYAGNPKHALEFITTARKEIEKANTLDSFYIDKWERIAHLQLSGDKKGFDHFKRELREKGLFEFERDCDRFLLKKTKDQSLLLHLYFGTPFKSLRQRICREISPNSSLPEKYFWNPYGCSHSQKNIQEVTFLVSGELKSGQLLHRTALELCSDFYRPHRLGGLFSKLFPGEHFNPETSLHRVQEAIRRLREWFSANSVPLTIMEKEGFYRIETNQPCKIQVANTAAPTSKVDFTLAQLKEHFQGNCFKLPLAASHLGMSESSLRRILKEGEERGLILRFGSGKGRQYSLVLH